MIRPDINNFSAENLLTSRENPRKPIFGEVALRMKKSYRVLRMILVTAIIAIAVLPAVLYVALSLSGVQRRIADTLETELSAMLDAKVTIGSLGIIPFNRVVLRNVAVEPTPGDTALTVRRLGAGVSLWDGLTSDSWRVDYVEIIGMRARIHRDSANAPMNIQPVIDALKPKDKNKPPTKFDLKVSTVLIRSSAISYDVLDRPRTDRLNPSHISISNLRADINLPRITNNDFSINIRRFAFEERSGLTLQQLEGAFHISDKELRAKGLHIELPASNLSFADMQLPLDGLNSIKESLLKHRLSVSLEGESHLWLPDVAVLYPPLEEARIMASFPLFSVSGTPEKASLQLKVNLEDMASLNVRASGEELDSDRRRLKLEQFSLTTTGQQFYERLSSPGLLPVKLLPILNALGPLDLALRGEGSIYDASAEISVLAAPGRATILADGARSDNHHFDVHATLLTDGFIDLSSFMPKYSPAGLDGSIEAFYSVAGKERHGNADIALLRLSARGIVLDHIASEITLDNDELTVNLGVNDPKLAMLLEGNMNLSKDYHAVDLTADLQHLVPDKLGLWSKYPGAVISGKIDVDMEGPLWRSMEGYASLSDITLRPLGQEGITLNRFNLTARNLKENNSRIDLSSDYLDGSILGTFDFASLGHTVFDIISEPFPALLPAHAGHDAREIRPSGKKTLQETPDNDFQFDFTIKETEKVAEFFRLPVSVIYPVRIKGAVSQQGRDLEFNLSAPYLRQGGKLIENTALSAYVDGQENRARLNFTTTMPTKGGPMKLSANAGGHDNMLRSAVEWKIDRERAYEGNIGAVTRFSRSEGEPLTTTVDIRKSSLTFNDSTWLVEPARITVCGKEVDIAGINVSHGNQFVKINGQISQDPTQLLTLDLRHFSLDYLFESLGIDAAMLGGDATGTFYASEIYSGHPALQTPGLHVKNISYNKTVLGDAVVRSHFEPADKSIVLDADIDNRGRRSTVNGAIFATRDSLDLTFNVDREPVGFLQPYMEAFASDITGYASGRARVYGNFKYIDLEGDIYADSVQMKVNFTNTTYWATDSVHIRPGYINLNGITVHDMQGHTAALNGWVRHAFFKEPKFEFAITGTRNLLCYNETPKENPRWYGRIFGDGSAFVKGVPGRVDINVDMSTAPGSTFTFVLTDQIDAEQYSFLTFRDKGKLGVELTDTIEMRDTSMDLVNRLREMASRHDESSSSDYNITIQMGITPSAQINLVMDPVGGDRIRAYGTGHLRMDYGSANNELKMYGNYTLDRGDYNFTLQDIIIKDFTIKPGSEISFRGDPYAAQLNLRAAYSLNANLSDLDESFLNDNDLNRTNVPVNAIMKVTGDIRQPEIAFDLEFPTLTSDIYRKVRSIISTDEMMNRQILYLLALNRFYTPEYMSGATRGNELVSVASSTLSSQLGNILGQISDNWNIAPALRSSRGDFSDVEVDVALSSRLLNNRLLFNGNFGYRDESLNSNQFVGDFDLEYLLNRSGNFRLKAYNRYNDQNYYLRSALTTQGVGIILRKDFDSLTSFLRPLLHPRRKSPSSPLAPPPSSQPASPLDSLSRSSAKAPAAGLPPTK